MKQEKLNIRKLAIGILVVLVAVIFCGCEHPRGNREEKEGYSIIFIDSCEYIEVSSMLGAQQGYYSLTHKGNCKFCTERNKKP